MRTIRQDLLTLLISLFIFSACKNTNDVGLGVDQSKQVELHTIDTSTIRTSTVREDTALTTGISQYPVGYLQDPELGTTESTLAMGVQMSSIDLAFNGTTVLDSAVLVLKYGTEFYGDSVNSKYKIDVHELTEPFNYSKFYYNNKAWSNGADIIGTKTVSRYYPARNVFVNVIRTGKADTTVYRGPHIRIPLNTDFVKNRFINAPAGTYATSATFASYFQGIYLNINKAGSTGKGGLITFNPGASDSSGIYIFYRNVNGSVIDTLVGNFTVSTSGAAANITHTYTTAVQNQLDNPTQQFTTVYAQPGAGLRTKITLPYISKMKALGNVLINKAELIVQSIDSSLDPAKRLTLYRSDIAGQRQPVPDNNVGQRSGTAADARAQSEANFGGYYDKTNKRYVFTITSYIQDLLEGKVTQYNTYLSTLLSTNVRGSASDVSSIANTSERAILGGGNNAQYKMKLKITYTLVK